MNRIDRATQQQVEDFDRNLDAMALFYQRQAYLAGLAQAKRAWDAMHASAPRPRIVNRRAQRILLAVVVAAIGVTLGSSLYLFVTHLARPTPVMPGPPPLSYWLNLVK